MSDDLLLTHYHDVAVLTLHRPDKRNALSADLLRELSAAVSEMDADESVRAMVLTGADPAFCAGIDLRNLGGELARLRGPSGTTPPRMRGFFAAHDTPIIGAINGPAVTGGLELALGCDFLIASDRATFADTHAKVGVMPGAGMTIRLPALVGIDRARRMTLTGEFIDAATALAWGLVTEVVAHDLLVDRALAVARQVAAIDPVPVAELRRMYADIGDLQGADAWHREREWNREWMTSRVTDETLRANGSAILDSNPSRPEKPST